MTFLDQISCVDAELQRQIRCFSYIELSDVPRLQQVEKKSRRKAEESRTSVIVIGVMLIIEDLILIVIWRITIKQLHISFLSMTFTPHLSLIDLLLLWVSNPTEKKSLLIWFMSENIFESKKTLRSNLYPELSVLTLNPTLGRNMRELAEIVFVCFFVVFCFCFFFVCLFLFLLLLFFKIISSVFFFFYPRVL